MMRNFDEIYSRPRGNLASCVLRQIDLERRRAEIGNAPGLDEWPRILIVLLRVHGRWLL